MIYIYDEHFHVLNTFAIYPTSLIGLIIDIADRQDSFLNLLGQFFCGTEFTYYRIEFNLQN